MSNFGDLGSCMQVNVRVHTDPNGLRGLVAARAMRKGDLLVSIPVSLAIPLGASSETAPVGRGRWVEGGRIGDVCILREVGQEATNIGSV